MALSHKGRYWQISGLEKQVAIARDYLYQRARWGVLEREISRIVRWCEALGAYPLFPTRPRRPFPSFSHRRRGRAASQLSSLGLSIQAPSRQLRPSTFRPPISMATLWR